MRKPGGRPEEHVLLELAPLLRAFLVRRVGVAEHELDDLVQETLLRALLGWEAFRDSPDGFAWLCGIARNVVQEGRRGSSRIRESLDATAVGESAADRDAAVARLRSLFLRVPPLERELLLERYVEGRSVREIARARGKSVRAMHSALTRARQRLRAAAEGDG